MEWPILRSVLILTTILLPRCVNDAFSVASSSNPIFNQLFSEKNGKSIIKTGPPRLRYLFHVVQTQTTSVEYYLHWANTFEYDA